MQDRTNFTSDDFIHLNSCGFSVGSGASFVTYRPNGRVDWHILYQIEGEFNAEYDGESIIVTPGDILIYPPHKPHLYSYPSGSRTVWIHFAGTAAESLLASLGLTDGIRRGTLDSLVVETFRHLVGLSGADTASVTVQNGVLITLLGFLARSISGESADFGENLVPAIRLMREEYSRQITIAECAALCHMSKSSFIHRFRDSVGISPYKFLGTSKKTDSRYKIYGSKYKKCENKRLNRV